MKLFWTGLLVVCANVNANDGTEFFEKNVRPVLVRQCLACHSSPTSPMGGLRLDTRESMIKGGTCAPAIVPGKPADSLILRAVRQPETLRMPPAGKLKDAEIAALADSDAAPALWVTLHAAPIEVTKSVNANQKYWAFIPPREPKLPEVRNTAWVKSPLDRFVLAALEAKGLTPAPAADKRTLIRRATFDLTGLLPAPEEIRAFLDDKRTDAFARVTWIPLATVSAGDGTGWTSHAMPIRMISTRTWSTAMPSAIATT